MAYAGLKDRPGLPAWKILEEVRHWDWAIEQGFIERKSALKKASPEAREFMIACEAYGVKP